MTTLLCLVGPTAAGKTRMAIDIALQLRERGRDPEVVSCDSMAVYRGLDVTADIPSSAERREIPHHLFEVVDPDEEFTAVSYRRLAREAIEQIDARGGPPMLVGGSGLYFRAVVDELEFAPTSRSVRARLEQEDPDALLERIRRADPATALRLDRRNARRIVRAAEVLELTGRPPSELRTSWDRRDGGPYELVVAGLSWDRDELVVRAVSRVQRQLDEGLLEEVRRIGSANFSRTARQALGVKEMIPVIEGDEDIDTASERLTRNIKSFVRRQLSWFGADPRVVWFNASELGFDGAREGIIELFSRAI